MAKEFKQVCREELKGSNISIKVQERGGRTLGQELGVKIPGMSKKESCGRDNCFPCNTGNEGVCRRTGVGYEICCEVCGQKSKYAGESGRNLYGRGCEYVSDFEKKRMNKPLWKHIVEKHQGDTQGLPMFSHFSMKLTSVFAKPQRRGGENLKPGPGHQNELQR